MLESSFKVNNSPAQNCMQEIVRLSAHGGNTCKMTFPGITPSPGSYYQKFLSILSSAWTAYLATQIVQKNIFCSKNWNNIWLPNKLRLSGYQISITFGLFQENGKNMHIRYLILLYHCEKIICSFWTMFKFLFHSLISKTSWYTKLILDKTKTLKFVLFTFTRQMIVTNGRSPKFADIFLHWMRILR